MQELITLTQNYLSLLKAEKGSFPKLEVSNLQLKSGAPYFFCLNPKWKFYTCQLPAFAKIPLDTRASLSNRENILKEIEVRIISYNEKTGDCLLATEDTILKYTAQLTLDPRLHLQHFLKSLDALSSECKAHLSFVLGPRKSGKTKSLCEKAKDESSQGKKVLILANSFRGLKRVLNRLKKDGPASYLVLGANEETDHNELGLYREFLNGKVLSIMQIEKKMEGLLKYDSLFSRENTLKEEVFALTEEESKLGPHLLELQKAHDHYLTLVTMLKTGIDENQRAINRYKEKLLDPAPHSQKKDISTIETKRSELLENIRRLESELDAMSFFVRFFTGKQRRLLNERKDHLDHLDKVEITLKRARDILEDLLKVKAHNEGILLKEENELKENQKKLAEVETGLFKIAEDLKQKRERYKFVQDHLRASLHEVLKLKESYEDMLQHSDQKSLQDLGLLKEKKAALEQEIQNYQLNLGEQNLLLMTYTNFLNFPKSHKFDIILVDESHLLTRAEALSLSTLQTKIIFFGDAFDLGPYCSVQNDDVKNFFGRSALSLKQENEFVELKESEHFGSKLGPLLDKNVYSSGLKSTGTNSLELDFIHCDPEEAKGRLKRQNHAEVMAIVKYLEEWWKENHKEAPSVAVLTAYPEQEQLLKEFLVKNFSVSTLSNYLEVMTVEKAQDREWDLVLFSVVDTTKLDRNQPLMTDSIKRKGKLTLSTLFSRCNKKCVFFLDKDFWQRSKSNLITDLLNL